jgi:hypothetical protein
VKWGDFILRLLVRRRDRETISGDLLEEYREHVLPTKGPWAARLWYVQQIASFVSPLAWGLMIGTVLGTFQLVNTAIEPLADDDAVSMCGGLVVILLLWTLASVTAGLPARSFKQSMIAGALAGVGTMFVFDITSILRVNLFLDQIRYRDDWINLIDRFEASGFQSLRAYANWEYLPGAPVIVGLGAVAGGACGIVAGVVNRILTTPWTRAST